MSCARRPSEAADLKGVPFGAPFHKRLIGFWPNLWAARGLETQAWTRELCSRDKRIPKAERESAKSSSFTTPLCAGDTRVTLLPSGSLLRRAASLRRFAPRRGRWPPAVSKARSGDSREFWQMRCGMWEGGSQGLLCASMSFWRDPRRVSWDAAVRGVPK